MSDLCVIFILYQTSKISVEKTKALLIYIVVSYSDGIFKPQITYKNAG